MAFQKEREDHKQFSGLWFLERVALGIGVPGLGFALYELWSDVKKDGEAPIPKDCEQCQASNDAYTRDRCFFCDDNIFINKRVPHKLSCDHVVARFFNSVFDCATKLRCDHVKARYHDMNTSYRWIHVLAYMAGRPWMDKAQRVGRIDTRELEE